MGNEVRFRIGEIEFEAKGESDVIERERNEFVTIILPLAVDAMIRTKSIPQTVDETLIPENSIIDTPELQDSSLIEVQNTEESSNFQRKSLSSFIKEKGANSNADFILSAAYFDEEKNNIKVFSAESAKNYYNSVRRPAPSNIHADILSLAQRGHIIDSPEHKGKTPKQYIISDEGIEYIKSLRAKDNNKLSKKTSSKSRQSKSQKNSEYSTLNADELNLKAYPAINTLGNFKEKMMMILYIVTVEKKGEWFSTNDVLCLMTDIFGEPANKDKVNGVFKRTKIWFKVEKQKDNTTRRKLLSPAKDYVKKLINR